MHDCLIHHAASDLAEADGRASDATPMMCQTRKTYSKCTVYMSYDISQCAVHLFLRHASDPGVLRLPLTLSLVIGAARLGKVHRRREPHFRLLGRRGYQ